MRILIATIMTLAMCPYGASQSKCGSVNAGVVSGHTYSNADLGLSYVFPSTMEPQQRGLPTATADAKILLAIWTRPRSVEKPNVIVLSDNPAQYSDQSVLAYARRILNTAVKHDSAEILVAPKPLNINGHEFYTVQYRYPQGPTYEGAVTGQINGCEISFEFTAASSQELTELLRSIDTIRLSAAGH